MDGWMNNKEFCCFWLMPFILCVKLCVLGLHSIYRLCYIELCNSCTHPHPLSPLSLCRIVYPWQSLVATRSSRSMGSECVDGSTPGVWLKVRGQRSSPLSISVALTLSLPRLSRPLFPRQTCKHGISMLIELLSERHVQTVCRAVTQSMCVCLLSSQHEAFAHAAIDELRHSLWQSAWQDTACSKSSDNCLFWFRCN